MVAQPKLNGMRVKVGLHSKGCPVLPTRPVGSRGTGRPLSTSGQSDTYVLPQGILQKTVELVPAVAVPASRQTPTAAAEASGPLRSGSPVEIYSVSACARHSQYASGSGVRP